MANVHFPVDHSFGKNADKEKSYPPLFRKGTKEMKERQEARKKKVVTYKF